MWSKTGGTWPYKIVAAAPPANLIMSLREFERDREEQHNTASSARVGPRRRDSAVPWRGAADLRGGEHLGSGRGGCVVVVAVGVVGRRVERESSSVVDELGMILSAKARWG